MTAPADLAALVAADLAQPVSTGARALTTCLLERYGSAVRGVLLYGSCLRRRDDEGVLDLYLLVDQYRAAYHNRTLEILNRWLPPNVFYLEVHDGARVVRAKYAVLSLDDLARGTSARTFEPYFWARFAQPCALLYAADEQAKRNVVAALSEAIVTSVRCGAALVAPRFTARELWTTTWRATYRTELRSERPQVVESLWASARARYIEATRLVVATLPGATVTRTADGEVDCTVALSPLTRHSTAPLWLLRRILGKTRFLVRMLRNALIFEGGVDYVLWKIQRHSGIETASTWRKERHPLLALGAHAWRLYRAGGFR